MCYNYFNDLSVARSMYRKQANQPLNNSNEINLRNTNRSQTNRSRTDSSSRSNPTAIKQILLDKEYSNLKNLLPSLNSKAKISKVNLINEAVRYINELQEQVIQKLNVDPQLIQQKILLQQIDPVKPSSEVSNNINLIASNSRSQSNKSSLRRTPLEEIDVQKSVKRQRI